MAASHYKADNLCAIIDQNGLQIDGFIHEIMSSHPIPDKWRGFGWHVIEINGHDYKAILSAYDEAEKIKGRPTVIVAKTIKGKVSLSWKIRLIGMERPLRKTRRNGHWLN